jgi:hypothetical protein
MQHHIILDVPTLGRIRATYSDDWQFGVTTYGVTAPRARGSFVLAPDVVSNDGIDPDTVCLRVEFGRRDTPDNSWWRMHAREDRPVVNGVDLVHAVTVDTSRIRRERLSERRLTVRRYIDDWRSEAAPTATAKRTAAVLDGLVCHWLGRPENYALRLHAAQAALAEVRAGKHLLIRSAVDRLAEARSDLAQYDAQLAEIQVFDALAHARADVA